MNAQSDIERFRVRLTELQAELLEREARIKAHNAAGVPADFADQATARENDDVISALDTQIGEELAQIGAALKRLERGEFGSCRECGTKIEEGRLELLPYTAFCSRCA